MKRLNKLGTHLAVAAWAGCAASVADAALVVVENPTAVRTANAVGNTIPESNYDPGSSFIFTTNGSVVLDWSPGSDALGAARMRVTGFDKTFVRGTDLVTHFENRVDGGEFARAEFAYGTTTLIASAGATVGIDNWVMFGRSNVNENTFNDSSATFDQVSWARFTITDGLTPTMSVNALVYDDGGLPVTLSQALASVPEPSSPALLALGATGLAARRRRKKAE